MSDIDNNVDNNVDEKPEQEARPRRYPPKDYDNKDDGGYGGDDKSGYRQSRPRTYFRKKVCRFCTQNYQIDYKNPDSLQRFLTDRGKILPRRITGTCAKHQRTLTTTIKRARAIALLPYVKK